MSTVDSLLILSSATILKDLYLNYIVKRKVCPEEEDVRDVSSELMKTHPTAAANVPKISFGITAVIGILTCLIALNPPDVIAWINLFAFGGLEPRSSGRLSAVCTGGRETAKPAWHPLPWD